MDPYVWTNYSLRPGKSSFIMKQRYTQRSSMHTYLGVAQWNFWINRYKIALAVTYSSRCQKGCHYHSPPAPKQLLLLRWEREIWRFTYTRYGEALSPWTISNTCFGALFCSLFLLEFAGQLCERALSSTYWKILCCYKDRARERDLMWVWVCLLSFLSNSIKCSLSSLGLGVHKPVEDPLPQLSKVLQTRLQLQKFHWNQFLRLSGVSNTCLLATISGCSSDEPYWLFFSQIM